MREVLPKRFERFGLTLHERRRGWWTSAVLAEGSRPGSFDLLGFTHFWGKSRKGHWVVQRKTAKKKFKQAVRRVYQWCKTNRHMP